MSNLVEMGKKAKSAAVVLATLPTPVKNKALLASADALMAAKDEILAKNKEDVDAALANGIKGAFIDRLTLTEARVADMADGLRQVAKLDDPVGEVLSMKKLDNGLVVGQKRVPMGVIGIIFEARPNVTADAAALCIKSGNACILRSGKEAHKSSMAITKVLRSAISECGLPEDSIALVQDTSRESAVALMRLNDYLDVIIPRGGAGLIRAVVENATVPAIETGTGNCHIYIDQTADLDMAKDIVINAKTSRPSVCNAAEKLLVHKSVAEKALAEILPALVEKGVTIIGDSETCRIYPDVIPATDTDWSTEYLDLKIGVKIVDSIGDAISHINKYNSGHSEAIITDSYENSQKFLAEVDAAAVYVNASTRFTDGFEFGFGAEIGISTQKLHARGPMGLKALTTTKYIIRGNGQTR